MSRVAKLPVQEMSEMGLARDMTLTLFMIVYIYQLVVQVDDIAK
jgi:hypothetical protein